MSQSNQRPPAPTAPPVPPRPIEEVGDDHGRPLTTNATAAAWYRAAQGSVVRGDGADPALRRALQADPTFAVAACDLLALTDDPPPAEPARPSTSWERHHCEIVAEAHRDVGRASGIFARASRRRRMRSAGRPHRVRRTPYRLPQRGSHRRPRRPAGVDGRVPSTDSRRMTGHLVDISCTAVDRTARSFVVGVRSGTVPGPFEKESSQ